MLMWDPALDRREVEEVLGTYSDARIRGELATGVRSIFDAGDRLSNESWDNAIDRTTASGIISRASIVYKASESLEVSQVGFDCRIASVVRFGIKAMTVDGVRIDRVPDIPRSIINSCPTGRDKARWVLSGQAILSCVSSEAMIDEMLCFHDQGRSIRPISVEAISGLALKGQARGPFLFDGVPIPQDPWNEFWNDGKFVFVRTDVGKFLSRLGCVRGDHLHSMTLAVIVNVVLPGGQADVLYGFDTHWPGEKGKLVLSEAIVVEMSGMTILTLAEGSTVVRFKDGIRLKSEVRGFLPAGTPGEGALGREGEVDSAGLELKEAEIVLATVPEGAQGMIVDGLSVTGCEFLEDGPFL